jgi:NitT/TauT family transport system permease protein
MLTTRKITYTKNEAIGWAMPNYWDILILGVIIGVISLLIYAAKQMTIPYDVGQPIPISLDLSLLPIYAVRTVVRMFIALFCALIFTFIFGTWAAKSKRAEGIIIPIIDIMQSLPVLSFLSIMVPIFIILFKGSMLGPECAAIFAIFTSQVWNITLSFYQSVSTVPKDLREVAKVFRLSTWRSFWRLEVPYAMPGLLWNMMMSMSASWFFVTASEAISIANQEITLPGVGSYIALAIAKMDKHAIGYAIIAMFSVIIIYDQLLFRPLVYWSEKFRFESAADARFSRSWVVSLFQRTRLLRQSSLIIGAIFDAIVNWSIFNPEIIYRLPSKSSRIWQKILAIISKIFIVTTILGAAIALGYFIKFQATWNGVLDVLWLGLLTGIRVMSLIILCSIIWVPIGVWIGFKPKVAMMVQPIIQFLAAFPANLLFPVVTFLVLKYQLNINIWVSPLMVLGTQWYILFNVIAGASTISKELRLVARNFGVKGWLKWKRLILPGIFPFFITGVITAAGGAWNASIVAEVLRWGETRLYAQGLGAYIFQYTKFGIFSQVALGTIVMGIYVLAINRLLWRPLYNIAIEKFKAD